MKKNITIAVLVILLIIALIWVVLPEEEDPIREEEPVEEEMEEEPVEEEEEDEDEDEEEPEEADFEERLQAVLEEFVGIPHKQQPLDEDTLYTEEGFDSTTLVLSLAAKANSEEDPEEEMKMLHYYPPGEVSYENRLHFTTYRNEVSDYFEDITSEIGSGYLETKTVTLNREREDEGRLIDIDWEEEMEIDYVKTEDISFLVPELPEVAGVAFLREGDVEMGLDVRTEAVLIGGTEIVYASSSEGEVVRGNLLDYLEESDFDGAIFYEFKRVNN